MTAPLRAAVLRKTIPGYFQIWRMPCGHEVRVNTESFGSYLRNPESRKKFNASTKARLEATGKCSDCRTVVVV
jgi:hypothetical protein